MDRPTLGVLFLGAVSGSLITLSLLRRSTPTQFSKAPTTDDDDWFERAHSELRNRSRRPSQSNFRVTAIVLFWNHGELFYTIGHNDESCALANSCCAERAAFLQLGTLSASSTVHAIYLVSDSPTPITPGVLCREFMLSSPFTTDATKVVMEGSLGSSTRINSTLGFFFPFASPYTTLNSREQVKCGRRLAGISQRISIRQSGHDKGMRELPDSLLMERVRSLAIAAAENDHRDDLHPISFGAACIFADGSSAIAHQKKALEYSCSLDAVCQLAPLIDLHHKKQGCQPVIVCMADQFGLCHAPFALGRSYLTESGLGDCDVLAQDEHGGFLVVKVTELVPGVPEWDRPP